MGRAERHKNKEPANINIRIWCTLISFFTEEDVAVELEPSILISHVSPYILFLEEWIIKIDGLILRNILSQPEWNLETQSVDG